MSRAFPLHTPHLQAMSHRELHAMCLQRVVGSKRLLAKLEKLYEAGLFSRIAVDEVHTVSSYADFRPDMKK